jgi:serine/threonine protein kinase
MGVIYKAEDIMLKRTVALKFLPLELTRDKEAKARFIREAQTAAPLDHPNICTFLNEKNSLLANIHGESRLKKLLQRVKREW